MLDPKAPRLAFAGEPRFNEGDNVTVRRGPKWFHKLNEEYCEGAEVVMLRGDGGVIGSATVRKTHVVRFLDLPECDLVMNHDPACRSYCGLLTRMEELYRGFTAYEYVTVVTFEVNP